MRVVKYKENELILQNLDNADEALLFEQLKNKLSDNDRISFDGSIEGPYCDLIDGKLDGTKFTLIYDFDYGVSIKSDNSDCLSKLENLINN